MADTVEIKELAPEDAKEALQTFEMPTSVRIGPFVHSIEEMTDVETEMAGYIGLYIPRKLQIRISPELPEQRKAETLLHEVLHGIYHTSGLFKMDDVDEETAVTAISTGLCQVIRDNMELVAYLVQQIQKED